jgi:hypothetical protein
MSVFFRVPLKSIFIPTHNVFTANFNSPVIGQYSFNTPLNTNVFVLKMQPDSVYMIDRITVGANIDESIYLNSIVDFPRISLRRKNNKMNLTPLPYYINNFARNSDFVVLQSAGNDTEEMLMTVNGLLNQIPDTIGVLQLKINSTDFNNEYVGKSRFQGIDHGVR